MRMFNADGSEGKMCGNGIRCVEVLYDYGMINGRTEITISNAFGIKRLTLYPESGNHTTGSCRHGRCLFCTPSQIPCTLPEQAGAPLTAQNGEPDAVTAVGMGNPHCVLFQEADVDTLELFRD